MEKELQIIIAGKANTGKSTMMLQLEKLLKENGYEVELSFENHPDYSGENSFFFHQKEQQYFPEKVEAIKSRTKIVLSEAQLRSDSLQERIYGNMLTMSDYSKWREKQI